MEAKRIKLTSWMLSAGLLLAFSSVQAQTAAAPTSTTAAAKPPSIFKQCAAENNITLPAKGSGQTLTDAQREEIHACIKTARKAAFEKCATGAGFTPGQGQRPTPTEKSSIRQCMASNGFHKHHHRHQQQQGSEASPS